VEDAKFCFVLISPFIEGQPLVGCLSASETQGRRTLALLDMEMRPDMRYLVLRFPNTSPAA